MYACNYATWNPFPNKFVYSKCLHRQESGRVCARSSEQEPKCDHGHDHVPSFHFQLLLIDVVHGGVAPLRAQLWDIAMILLGFTPLEFSALSPVEQTFRVHGLTQLAPRLRVSLYTNDFKCKVNHLSFVDQRPIIIVPLFVNVVATLVQQVATPV